MAGMSKTAEEIKKGLECCGTGELGHHDDCPYCIDDHKCMQTVLHDALALIRQLEAKMPKWISVEDRLPGEVESVLCIVRYGEDALDYELGFFLRNKWHTAGRSDGVVSHWMPLPEPPPQKEEATCS